MALSLAQEPRLRVFAVRSSDSGEDRWEARVLDKPDFIMEAKPSMKALAERCRAMGWVVSR